MSTLEDAIRGMIARASVTDVRFDEIEDGEYSEKQAAKLVFRVCGVVARRGNVDKFITALTQLTKEGKI